MNLPTSAGDRRLAAGHRGCALARRSQPQGVHAARRRRDSRAIADARKRGQLSHELFIKLGPPGEPLELLGLDIWCDEPGMNAHYEDATHMRDLAAAFSGKPSASTWRQAAGNWSEW